MTESPSPGPSDLQSPVRSGVLSLAFLLPDPELVPEASEPWQVATLIEQAVICSVSLQSHLATGGF